MELSLFDDGPVAAHIPTFDEWYRRYPKHEGKAAARGRWARMSPAERASAWAALPGWERYAAASGIQFVPMASTWLNQSRWLDDPPQPARKSAPGMGAVRRALQATVEVV
jgi:hypothetical protein